MRYLALLLIVLSIGAGAMPDRGEEDPAGILPPPVYFENLEEVLAGLRDPYKFINKDIPDPVGRAINYIDAFIGWASTSWLTIYGYNPTRDVEPYLIGFGTAWAVMSLGNFTYWISAYHCAVDIEGVYQFTAFRIRQDIAELIYANEKVNIAIWRTPKIPGVVPLYTYFGLGKDGPRITNKLSVGEIVIVTGWSVVGEPENFRNPFSRYRLTLVKGTTAGYVISTLPNNLIHLSADFWAFFGAIPGFSGSPVVVYRPNDDGILNFNDFYLVGILNVGAYHYLGMTFIPLDLFDKIKELHKKLTDIELWPQ